MISSVYTSDETSTRQEKSFHIDPPITLRDFTNAVQWLKNEPQIVKPTRRVPYYLIKPCQVEEDEFHSARIQCKKLDFDGMMKRRMACWRVDRDVRTCNCPSGLKKPSCKHVLGIRILLKKVKVPDEAKNIPIGAKRKRGRPAKAKKALLHQ